MRGGNTTDRQGPSQPAQHDEAGHLPHHDMLLPNLPWLFTQKTLAVLDPRQVPIPAKTQGRPKGYTYSITCSTLPTPANSTHPDAEFC